MKKAEHAERKSSLKWGLGGQRTMTSTMEELVARRAKSKRPFMVGRPFKNYGRLRFGSKLADY
jgi:hypothetical protein